MSIRSALLASAAILVAGSAFAADLPARIAPAPYIAAPIFTWTGFYVGLNAGGAWNSNNGFSSPGFIIAPTIYGASSNNDTGFTGGVQAGYNWQFGSFVTGVEADINYADNNRNGNTFVPTVVAPGTYYTVSRNGDSNNWFGTLRARFGVAFDRALIYGTGGLAFGGNNGGGSVSQTIVTGPPLVSTTTTLVGGGNNNSNVGWALGAGVEYAFTNSLSAKVEYLHVDLGRNNRTFTVTPTTFIAVHDDAKFDLVRAGLNFRF